MAVKKDKQDSRTQAQHLRLPVWLVDLLKERGKEQQRPISHQIVYELCQVEPFASANPNRQ